MIANHLIEILRCPLDGSELHLADAELLARLNRAVAAGELKSMAGETFEKPLDGGLIRAAGDLLYPIIDEIPVMLPDEAVDLRACG